MQAFGQRTRQEAADAGPDQRRGIVQSAARQDAIEGGMQRLARATGLILAADSRWASLYRYARRTLFERDRAGALEGAKDSIKWDMIHWIMVRSPVNQIRYHEALVASGLPLVEVHGMAGVNRLYDEWGLTRK